MSNSIKSRAICILGMHRSGTSAITRTVNLAGVYLGEDLLAPQKDNPKGFWENKNIMEFNDRVLESIGTSWDDVNKIDPTINKLEMLDSFKEELKTLVHNEFDGFNLWGWKDPRTCLLLPLWTEVLAELEISVDFIIPIRNPIEVAESLSKRNGFSHKKGILLWYKYTLMALMYSRGFRRVFVDYHKFLTNWQDEFSNIINILNLEWPSDRTKFESDVSEFVTPSLRHNKATEQDAQKSLPVPISNLYSLLINHNFIKEAVFDAKIDDLSKLTLFIRDYYVQEEFQFKINYEVNDNNFEETNTLSTLTEQVFVFKQSEEGITNISILPINYPAIFRISVYLVNEDKHIIYSYNSANLSKLSIENKTIFEEINVINKGNKNLLISLTHSPKIILPSVNITGPTKIYVLLKVYLILTNLVLE